jgi:hypothetical protein
MYGSQTHNNFSGLCYCSQVTEIAKSIMHWVKTPNMEPEASSFRTSLSVEKHRNNLAQEGG